MILQIDFYPQVMEGKISGSELDEMLWPWVLKHMYFEYYFVSHSMSSQRASCDWVHFTPSSKLSNLPPFTNLSFLSRRPPWQLPPQEGKKQMHTDWDCIPQSGREEVSANKGRDTVFPQALAQAQDYPLASSHWIFNIIIGFVIKWE